MRLTSLPVSDSRMVRYLNVKGPIICRKYWGANNYTATIGNKVENEVGCLDSWLACLCGFCESKSGFRLKGGWRYDS